MKASVSAFFSLALLLAFALISYFQLSWLLKEKPILAANIERNDALRRTQENPNLLRMFLSGKDKDADIIACQIPNVCMEFSNTRQIIHVPEIYRKIKPDLLKCLSNPRWPRLTFYNKSSPLSKTLLYDFDLVGVPFNNGYYHHFAHWIPEFMRNNMVPLSFFSSFYSSYPTQCISPVDRQRQECVGKGNIKAKLAFSIKAIGSNRHWNHALLNLLLKETNGNNKSISILPEAVRKTPVCFRSVLTSPNVYNSTDKIHDALLRNAGIERNIEVKKGEECRPNIVVILRDSSKSLDRTIPPEIMKALRKEMPSIEVVEDLGKLSLKGQISIMQRANILICVHGAEISNLIFVRERTRMIEIFPFGYKYPYFNRLYEFFNVRNVRRIFSKPDVERFVSCITKRAAKNMPKIFFNQQIKQRVLKEYLRYVAAKNGKFRSKDYAAYYCARTQRILIDPKHLARVAQEEARLFCNPQER